MQIKAKINKKIIILLMILIISLISRNFLLKTYYIRPEDLSILLGFISLLFLYKNKINFDEICIRWILICQFGYLSALLTFNIILFDISTILFYIKFLMPLVLYIIIKDNRIDNKNEFIIYLSLIFCIILFQIYRIIFEDITSLYGRSPIGYEDSPINAGFYYIFLQIILVYLFHLEYNFKNKYIYLHIALNIIIFILVINTGSKVAIIISLSVILSILFKYFKISYSDILLISIIFFLIFPVVFLLIFKNSTIVFSASHSRLLSLYSPIELILQRGNWFKLNWLDGFYILSGGGLSIGHLSENLKIVFGMHFDNEILFRYVTTGIIGIILMIEFLFFIAKNIIHKNNNYLIFILFGYVLGSIGAEIYNLSLTSCVFFIYLAITNQKNA